MRLAKQLSSKQFDALTVFAIPFLKSFFFYFSRRHFLSESLTFFNGCRRYEVHNGRNKGRGKTYGLDTGGGGGGYGLWGGPGGLLEKKAPVKTP